MRALRAQAAGAGVERVVITRRVGGGGGTYYARIVLNLPGGAPEAPRLVSVDSRPSDSIALALQAGAALFVAKDLARCLAMRAVRGIAIGFGSLQAVTPELWV